MSVDYELVCHRHKEKVSICSDGFSGPLLQCDKSLSKFCITHRNCDIRIISEDNESCDFYKTWDINTEVQYDLK